MLLSIECDKFPETHRVITFSPGLNSVVGTEAGSNAIGKSTFLRIIDFAFGGNCYLKEEEIAREIGDHEIYFSFQFGNNSPLYYCRKTNDPYNVISCDKEKHVIETMAVLKYQRNLMENYSSNRFDISLHDISEHFFRIYRRLNVLEQYPLSAKPSENHETTVNFLIKLFRHGDILNQIQAMAKDLHVDTSKVRASTPEKIISLDEIADIQTTIDSLKKRLLDNMGKNEVAQTQLFGYNSQEMKRAEKIRKELSLLATQQSKLKAQLGAIQHSMDIQSFDSAEDFEDLQTFFPEITMQKLDSINGFHDKIRGILLGELSKEEKRLKNLLARCDREVTRLQNSLKDSGTAQKMSTQLVSECASLMNSIERYEAQKKELEEERNRQQKRAAAKKQVRDLLEQERSAIRGIENELNSTMSEINASLIGDAERAPSIHIAANKDFTFGIRGNSSEGAAFRSMVVYDLAILKLCDIPVLIHDSNILKRIDDHQLEQLLECYENSGHQVFIAYDRLSDTTEKAHGKLLECAALRLSKEDLLFGRSWSKKKIGGKA